MIETMQHIGIWTANGAVFALGAIFLLCVPGLWLVLGTTKEERARMGVVLPEDR